MPPYDAFTKVIENNSGNDLNSIQYFNSGSERSTRMSPLDIGTIKPTVADTSSRPALRFLNLDNLVNSEFLEIKASGTSGYVMNVMAGGTGSLRTMNFSVNNTQQFYMTNAGVGFKSSRLYLLNPAGTFNYQIVGGAITVRPEP